MPAGGPGRRREAANRPPSPVLLTPPILNPPHSIASGGGDRGGAAWEGGGGARGPPASGEGTDCVHVDPVVSDQARSGLCLFPCNLACRRERQAGLAALGAELESAHALAQHAEEARAEHAPHLRGLLHHACVPASVWATAGLARAARSRAQLAGALAFGGGTCMMFAASAALHRGPALWGGTPWSRRRPWTCPAKAHFFSRLDRVGIFTAIAGGYYGLVGLALRGGKRVAVLSAVAVTSGIGALSHLTLALRGHNKDGTTPTFLPRWAEAAACTALSFAFLLAGPGALANGMGTEVYRRVRAGGVAYIAGAACYALKWPDCWLDKAPRWWGSHEMFHAGTVAGAAMHFRAMFDLVSRAHIMPA